MFGLAAPPFYLYVLPEVSQRIQIKYMIVQGADEEVDNKLADLYSAFLG